MPQGLTGVTTNTASRWLLDAAKVYVNVGEDELKDASASDPFADAIAVSTARLLGAMRGSVALEEGRTIRDVPANGLLGPTKGFKRRERVEPFMSGEFIEATSDNWQDFLPGSDTSTEGIYTSIYGGPIEDADYFDNIAMATHYTGSTDYVVVLLKNVLPMLSNLTLEDRNEGVFAVEFRPHFPADDPQNEKKIVERLHPGNS